MDEFIIDGDLSFVLPYGVNISELVVQLADGSFVEKLKGLYVTKDDKATREAFESDNFHHATIELILSDEAYRKYFVPFFQKDRLFSLYLTEEKVRKTMHEFQDYRNFQNIFETLVAEKTEEEKQAAKASGAAVIPYSIITGLQRWRKLTIPDGELSDPQFIKIVSDTRLNIEYMTDPEKHREIINRFGKLLDNGILLAEEFYDKMFGVMCELVFRAEDALKPFVILVIKTIKTVRASNNYASMDDVFAPTLSGFRKLNTSPDDFAKVKAILVQEGVLNGN
jgi:hypothetical protein